MIEIQSVAQEIHQASHKLAKGIDVLFTLAKENAEAERNYRSALAKEIVKLKQEGMQTTLIPDIARGNQSDLKYIRDIAEFKYRTIYKGGLKDVQALKEKCPKCGYQLYGDVYSSNESDIFAIIYCLGCAHEVEVRDEYSNNI